MTLTVDGVDHVLQPYRPFAFDGGAATSCELGGGPTRDLNVMTTLGRCVATVSVHEEPDLAVEAAGETLVVPLSGARRLHDPSGDAELACLDAARLAAGWSGRMTGAGHVAVVRISPWPAAAG